MSWHFSQALVEAYSVENCSDGEPSVPLSGTHTQQAFLSHGKMTAFSRLSRFGMMCKPLTDSRGEALLTWFLEGFPARTFHQQERVLESTEKPLPCGSIWLESAVRYCLDSSSWRTHRCLWDEVLPESSVTLPQWGMMQDGVLWERTMPAHLTSETESGCWVGTPTASMTVRSEEFAKGRIPQPAEFVKRWPTPQAHKTTESGEIVNADGTPWDGKSKPHSKSTGRPITTALADAVKFATPQARDFRTGQQSRWENPERTRNLNDQIGGQLNPSWVEWLMGWPLEWTDLKPSGTGKFQEWLDSHGRFYREGLTNE